MSYFAIHKMIQLGGKVHFIIYRWCWSTFKWESTHEIKLQGYRTLWGLGDAILFTVYILWIDLQGVWKFVQLWDVCYDSSRIQEERVKKEFRCEWVRFVCLIHRVLCYSNGGNIYHYNLLTLLSYIYYK